MAQHTAGMPGLYPHPRESNRPTTPLSGHTAGMQFHTRITPEQSTSFKRPWPGIKNLDHMKRKCYFTGGNDPPSNFHMANLRMHGHIFASLKHAYQWNKAKYLDWEDIVTHILNARIAAQAKRIADEELNAGNTNW